MRSSSPQIDAGTLAAISTVIESPLRSRERLLERGDLAHERGRIELAVVERELAGLDARDVEAVVDEPEQELARLMDRLRVAALALVERGRKQELAHAEHAGHRRADLVTHRREEVRFRLGELLGALAPRFGERERMTALDAQAVRIEQRKRDADQHERIAEERGRARPGRRCDRDGDRRERIPGAVGVRCAHLQRIGAGRELRIGALAARRVDPFGIESGHLEPIAVRRRIGIRERAHGHAEINVVVEQINRHGGIERDDAPGTAHAQADELQRRRRRIEVQVRRIERDDAVL